MKTTAVRKKYTKITDRLREWSQARGGSLVCLLRGSQRVWVIVGVKPMAYDSGIGIHAHKIGPTLGELARKVGI